MLSRQHYATIIRLSRRVTVSRQHNATIVGLSRRVNFPRQHYATIVPLPRNGVASRVAALINKFISNIVFTSIFSEKRRSYQELLANCCFTRG
jgi:hypothetical protein